MRRVDHILGLLLLAGAASVLGNGCGSNKPGATSDAPPIPTTDTEKCSVDGATRDCHINIGEQAGARLCFNGTQVCQAGGWSPCGSGSGTVSGTNIRGDQLGMQSSPDPERLTDSPTAKTIVDRVRSTFVSTNRPTPLSLKLQPGAKAPPVVGASFPTVGVGQAVVGADAVVGFELPVNDRVAVRQGPRIGVQMPARVELPFHANGAVQIMDEHSRVGIAVRLLGTSPSEIAVSGGIATYASALSGADVIQRPLAEGVEDYVLFTQAPSTAEVSYNVDVSQVAGLRLVGGVLEFLDAGGAPRMRVAPPYLVDSTGARRSANLSLQNCSADTSPAAPWGRPITPPGATSCGVKITWDSSAVTYPAILDPVWTTTGDVITSRYFHVSSPLVNGKVLVTGGWSWSGVLSASELYDPATNSFAATGAMTTARIYAAGASLTGGGAIISGGDDASWSWLNTAETYNEATGTFTATAGPMLISRDSHEMKTLANGKVLVLGGGSLAVDLYDPVARTFSATGSLSTWRWMPSSVVLASGDVLVVSGWTGGGIATAEKYNVATGTFSAAGNPVTARYLHRANLLPSGKVLVMGGIDTTSWTNTVAAELYDPTTNNFTATGPLLQGRYYFDSAPLPSGKVVVAGGYNGAYLSEAEIYDPTAGTFAVLPSMNYDRYALTLTRLTTGKIAAIGGYGSIAGLAPKGEILTAIPKGDPCGSSPECESGVCNDGICCAGACAGSCKTCKPATGACVTRIGEQDPDTCTGAQWCDGAGVCSYKPANCNNVCDPACLTYANNPDGGITSVGTVVVGGGGGNIAGLPNGFANKGLKDLTHPPTNANCVNSGSCQYDYHCDTTVGSPTRGKCVSNAANYIDPTCAGTGKAELGAKIPCTVPATGLTTLPICNHGDANAPAGIQVVIYNGNSNQLQSQYGTCVAGAGTVAATCTTTEAIPKGTCIVMKNTDCPGGLSAALSGTKNIMVNANLGVAECQCNNDWTTYSNGTGACPTVTTFPPVTYKQSVTASCALAKRVRWGYLEYNSTLESNASGSATLTIQAHTAQPPAAIAATCADCVTLATAPSLDNEDCLLVGPSPCPVNVYNKLGGLPKGEEQTLELVFTINPTPDAAGKGTLNSWQLTYTCVDDT